MKILITGSEGSLGKIISNSIKDEHKLTLLDKKLGTDILTDDITPYFKHIKTVIHLVANPNAYMGKEETQKNIQIVERVIEACKKTRGVRRIINASSIHVYPYLDIFDSGGKITVATPLSPNIRGASPGHYGWAKIEVERLFEEYCRKNNTLLVNLRFGAIHPDNQYPRDKDGKVPPIEYEVFLDHKDLVKIIERGIDSTRIIKNYVCVSKRGGLFDDTIRFPV